MSNAFDDVELVGSLEDKPIGGSTNIHGVPLNKDVMFVASSENKPLGGSTNIHGVSLDKDVMFVASSENKPFGGSTNIHGVPLDKDVMFVASSENKPIGGSINMDRHNDFTFRPGCNWTKFVPDHLKYNRELVLAAVRQNSSVLQFMSDELKSDPEIIFMAVANFPKAELDYMKQAIAVNKEAFFNPSDYLKDFTKDMLPVERYMLYAKNAIDTAPVGSALTNTYDNMPRV